jgi:hypothetical protein
MHKNIQKERCYEQSETTQSNFAKKYKSVFFLCFMMCSCIGFSQADTIAHLYTFGGDNNDNAEEIEATSDGGYIVVGSTSSNSSGNTDVYLLKVDSVCNYEWSFALGGANNDWGYSVKQTFDKGYIIAASSNSYGNGGYDAVLMKRDSLGGFVWQKKYGGQDWDFAYSVVQTFDSGYVFCGETYNNTSGYSDVYVVKTNPLGDTLWTQTIGGTLIDKGNCVIETSDSNIVIAGLTNTIADSTQAYVIKLDRNGVLLWDSAYGESFYEKSSSIIEAVNGDYVLNGTTSSFNTADDLDHYLVRVDKDGVLIWSNYFGSPGDEEAFDLKESASGILINVGYTKGFGAGLKDAQLFYITATGLWGGLGVTFGSSQDEVVKSLTIGSNDDFVMSGFTSSYGSGLDDMFLVRLDTIYASQNTVLFEYNDLVPISVHEYYNQSNVSVYPNPVNQYLNIEIDKFKPTLDYAFELYSIHGELVKSSPLYFQSNKIDIGYFSNQFYLYKVMRSGITIKTGKLGVF